MKIKQRRIHNLDAHLGFVRTGTPIVLGVLVTDVNRTQLHAIGFSEGIGAGEVVLPAAIFGPVSRYNANGKDLVHRDQPKETVSYVFEWHWFEYHGLDKVEQSDFVSRPYRRYPRTFQTPPSLELQLAHNVDGSLAVVIHPIDYINENKGLLKHAVNLFLEIFGECEVMAADLDQVFQAPIKRVNWEVLPPGKWPWERLKERIQEAVIGVPKSNLPWIWERWSTVNIFSPTFVSVGRAGFRGYVIFGFPERSLFVAESARHGNATYVFAEDWDTLSQMTKAQILDENLHKYRIIHTNGWKEAIRGLLS